jgi:hypothetical protein
MGRISESDALERDDGQSSTSRERDTEPQAFNYIDATAWSRRLVPHHLRHRAVSVDVSTPATEYTPGQSVPFVVTMRNLLPIPITVAVRSPVRWTWSVDGHVEASHVDRHDPPDRRAGFAFSRGERKQFRRRWDGMFQVSDVEWELADPGEYTIGAGLNVDDAPGRGLYDETTVRIVPE